MPDRCELCGEYVGPAWDVHAVLRHPETRPRPERPPAIARRDPGRRRN